MTSIRIFICFAFLSLLIFVNNNGFAFQKREITLKLEHSEQSCSIPALIKDEVTYFSLKTFAERLNFKYFINEKKRKIVIQLGTGSLIVSGYNPFLILDEEIYQMPLVTVDTGDDIYVPAAIFITIVGYRFFDDISFNNDSKVLTVNRFNYNILSINVETKNNGSSLHIHTNGKFEKSDISTSFRHGWLYVTVLGGKIDTVQNSTDTKRGIVDKIVAFQFDKSSQITFKLDREINDKSIDVKDNEIIISVWHKVQPVMETDNSIASVREKWLIDRIIIDPGHGGRDPGAVGPNGTKEKDITLDISKRLKTLLEDRLDVKVFLTRNDDSYVGLQERTKFANKMNGKLFISIHANATRNNNVRGFSTWVLGKSKTKMALEVAEKENSVIEYDDSYTEYKDASYILNAIAQNSYLNESLDMADIVNDHLKVRTRIQQWGKGVFQAGFFVLVGASMPRVLVETAFLSNPYEERQLRTRTFRQKIALALYESILKFKKKYEKEIGTG
ncbi:MAG: N-acetylmuramoyl-L-alanine amidase [bacterium]